MTSQISNRSRRLTGKRSISYAKWGYIFLIPFFAAYIIFSLYPLFSTFYYSVFRYFEDPGNFGQIVGPDYVGMDNFKALFERGLKSPLVKYFSNTVILWIVGFIPQIIVSLVLAKWFTDIRLNLKATGFFKAVIYLPNIIMAASMGMIFFLLCSPDGPVGLFVINHINSEYNIFQNIGGSRAVIAFINFLMWYGNTTILLMAAIMGIDLSLYESAQIDGASSSKIFFKITLPLIRPILLFVVITSLIGGIQMFDIPQTITFGFGNPDSSCLTVVMFLNNTLGSSRNFGDAGAISVCLFIVTLLLSFIVFIMNGGLSSKKGAK